MMRIERHVLGALVRYLGIRPGALGLAFFDAVEDPAYAAQVGAWWAALPAGEKLAADAVEALARPALVADVRVMQGRDSLIRTWAVSGAGEGPGPLVLAAADGDDALKVQCVETRDEYADTLLTWMVAAGEPSEPEMKVELTHAEFAALLAMADLHSRTAFAAYLDHEPARTSYGQEFIEKAYTEGVQVNDARWLWSFTAPLVDDAASQMDGAQLGQALEGLARRGLIERAGAEWKWTLPGEYLAESLHRRQVTVGMDTAGTDARGEAGTHAALLVRSDEPLWYADIPGGANVTVCGISMQAARQMLDLMLKPAGPALEVRVVAPPPPPIAAVPPPPPPMAGAAFCPGCGLALPPGAVFCGNCGTRLG